MTRPIKPARTASGRRRQIQRLAAEALAPADPRITATSESTPDVAALVAVELDRRAAEAEARAAAADEARYTCPTGGCYRCGLWGQEYEDGTPARWYPDGEGRWLCTPCQSVFATWPGLTPSERRLLDIARLIGLSTGAHSVWPMRPAEDFDSIPGVLFVEVEGAEPGLPWAHVDVEALRQAYEQVERSSTSQTPPTPWPTRKGRKCAECGGTRYLETTGMPMSHWPVPEDLDDAKRIEWAERMLCAGCRRRWLAQAGGVPA